MMKNFSALVSSSFAKAMVLGIAATATGIVADSAPARAASLSFVGSFAPTNPNQLFTTTFVSTSSSLVNFRSTGYAAGGFEPILTVFDNPTGNFIFQQYLSANGDSDFNVDRTLAAGNYKVVLSAFANFLKQQPNILVPRNIADGFENQGEFFGQNPTFAFSINNVNLPNATAVPEPADLIGTVIGGFGVVMFKRKLSARKKI
jgi:hypothetical protein